MISKVEVFQPNIELVKENELNVFTGFNYTKMKQEYSEDKVKNFLDHVKYVCGDVAGSNGVTGYEYMLNWMAQIVQRPWEKTGTCIVIYGSQGIGKDSMYEYMKRILGSQYCHSATPDRFDRDVFGNFNAEALRYKFLINLQEVDCGNIMKHMASLKGKITAIDETTEVKGIGQFTTKSYSRWFLTSNDSNPIKIEDSNRRFCVIKSSAEPRSKQYFDMLYKELEDESIIFSIYTYLLQRDISKVNFKEFVLSTYLDDLKEYSCPPTIGFLQDLFQDGALDSMKRITTGDLFEKYRNYCAVNGIVNTVPSNRLSLELNVNCEKLGMKKLPKWIDLNRKTHNGFQINLIQLQAGLLRYGINV
jgi:hypothetical protein